MLLARTRCIPGKSSAHDHRRLQTAALNHIHAVVARERKPRDPREENVPGDFYVDSTCIDCDTCRWMAPDFYARISGQTAIHHQPETSEERKRALQALLACPSFSIHARNKGDLGAALQEIPVAVPGTDNCFHLVMASEGSYGGAAYLVRRPGGNIMMESPRFDRKLLKRIQALGGVKYIFMTHRDDVCDHAQWAEALGCQRILHQDECNAEQGTDKVEIKLEGSGPWKLPEGDDDIELIWTPGHTTGHVIALYKPDRVIFSGDHWVYGDFWGEHGAQKRAGIARDFCWNSVERQIDSIEALKQVDFLHVLPGHGRPMSFPDAAAKDAYVDISVAAERAESKREGAAVEVFAKAQPADPYLRWSNFAAAS